MIAMAARHCARVFTVLPGESAASASYDEPIGRSQNVSGPFNGILV